MLNLIDVITNENNTEKKTMQEKMDSLRRKRGSGLLGAGYEYNKFKLSNNQEGG